MKPTDVILVVILVLYFGIVFWVDVVLLRRAGDLVRERHPAEWAALNVRSVHSIPFVRFVRNKGYLALHDPELTAVLTFKRRFDVLTGLALVVAVLAVVAWQRAHQGA